MVTADPVNVSVAWAPAAVAAFVSGFCGSGLAPGAQAPPPAIERGLYPLLAIACQPL